MRLHGRAGDIPDSPAAARLHQAMPAHARQRGAERLLAHGQTHRRGCKFDQNCANSASLSACLEPTVARRNCTSTPRPNFRSWRIAEAQKANRTSVFLTSVRFVVLNDLSVGGVLP